MPHTLPPTSPSPLPKLPKGGRIFFRHSGYDDSSNVLFKLYAIDTDTDSSHDSEKMVSQRLRPPGLYAQFALDACAIIARNRANGWLSTSRNPGDARNTRVDAGNHITPRHVAQCGPVGS
jgi:hypothetical protein